MIISLVKFDLAKLWYYEVKLLTLISGRLAPSDSPAPAVGEPIHTARNPGAGVAILPPSLSTWPARASRIELVAKVS